MSGAFGGLGRGTPGSGYARSDSQPPRPGASAGEWAAYFIDTFNWALVPVRPGSKRPRGERWNQPRSGECPEGYITDSELARKGWRKSDGIGAVLSPSLLVSLDVDDLEATRTAVAAAGLNLDELLAVGPRIEGRPGRAKVLYSAPDLLELPTHKLSWPAQPGKRKGSTVFELRAGDVQDILPPTIHKDTREPYRWIRPPWDAEGIPPIPAGLLDLWQKYGQARELMIAACPWRGQSEAERRTKARQAAFTTRIEREGALHTIRQRLSVTEMLRRMGATEAGAGKYNCPFHPPDEDPSFWIFMGKDGAERWSDGHGDAPVGFPASSGFSVGDSIDLYVYWTGLRFPEAIESLAVEVGVELPRRTGRGSASIVDASVESAGPAPHEGLSKELALLRTTDNDNGIRLIRRFGDRLRFNKALGWLVWDGRRWVRDSAGQASEFAKQAAGLIFDEAKFMDDKAARDRRCSWANASAMGKQRREMLRAAESDPAISLQVDELDRDPWLLNVQNGTVDLRTGQLRPHDRRDAISLLAGASYDPAAVCPKVDAFLDRILDKNAALIDYLWRVIGYSLTGLTNERALFCLIGEGGNGKSTIVTLIRELLGDYAMATPAETFIGRRSGSIPNDLARLRRVRFVATVEVEDGGRLAESLVKQVTGGDAIAARFMHGEWFDFVPEFKLFLAANHKPLIRGTDNAIWERIRLIPFNVVIPKAQRNRKLITELRSELPGVLARAVRGCLEWQAKGLADPEMVLAATEAYRSESDGLKAFIEERCVLLAEAKVSAADLRAAYESYCKDTGETPLRHRVVAERLNSVGATNTRGTGGYFWWCGIGLVK